MSIFKHDAKKEIWQYGLLGGLGEGFYILLIANFFQFIQKHGPYIQRPFWAFLFFLTCFVFSAVVSGVLVLGRPAILLVKKDYQEAVLTLLVSLGVLFLMLVAVIILAIA